ETVRQRGRLDGVVATTQVQKRDEKCRRELEGDKLEDISQSAAAPARDREAIHRHPAVVLDVWLACPSRANDVDLMTLLHERTDLAADARIHGEDPLSDHADASHQAGSSRLEADTSGLASKSSAGRPSATPSTIIVRLQGSPRSTEENTMWHATHVIGNASTRTRRGSRRHTNRADASGKTR